MANRPTYDLASADHHIMNSFNERVQESRVVPVVMMGALFSNSKYQHQLR